MATTGTTHGTADQWAAVAKRGVSRRTDDLGLAQRELVRRNLSVTNIGKLESGRGVSYRNATIRAYEDALGWLPGSVQQILDGGEPAIDPLIDGGDRTIVVKSLDADPSLKLGYSRRPGWSPEKQAAFEQLVREAADLIFGTDPPAAS